MERHKIIKVLLVTVIAALLIFSYPFSDVKVVSKNAVNDEAVDELTSIYLNPKNYVLFTKDEIFDIWLNRNYYDSKIHSYKEYKPSFDKQTFLWYYDVLETLFQTLTNENIPYFLVSGGMIGSYRHQGQIPWDDDMDIFIEDKYKDKVKKLLNSIPNYYLANHGEFLKFYHFENSLPVRKYPKNKFAWPMVDIFFYKIFNETHLVYKMYKDAFMKRSHIYPFAYGVFWNWMLPVPYDIENFFEDQYSANISICQDSIWSHKHQTFSHTRPKKIECSKFQSYFPLVERICIKKKCKEVLKKNGTILRTIPYPINAIAN